MLAFRMPTELNTATVCRFNGYINARNLEGLSAMMTDDHTFIDAANQKVFGKAGCVRAWQGFFAAFPDYQNHFEHVIAGEDFVIIAGRSSCSDRRLDGPTLWSATVRDALVSEWRVLEDNESNRSALGFPAPDRD